MRLKKYSLVVLSILILLIFIDSISAVDVNETDVVSTIDELSNVDNEKFAIDSNQAYDVESKDTMILGNETNGLLSVNDSESNGIVLKENAGNFDDLKAEIEEGINSGYVTLKKDIYKIDGGYPINIYARCTIDGNGAIVDMAGSDFSIFDVDKDYGRDNYVTFKNLIIKNSNSNYGPIVFDMGGGSVENCTFVNNYGTEGGAINVQEVRCDIYNCTFVNNSAEQGGAIFYASGQYGVVENCVFVNNSAVNCSAIWGVISSVNDNWWGSNNPIWSDLIGGIVPSSYAVLNVSANPTTMDTESKAKLNYAFYRNESSDLVYIPARPIELSATGGKLEKSSGIFDYGKFSTDFSSNKTGVYNISATVDNQNVKIAVNVGESEADGGNSTNATDVTILMPTKITSSGLSTVYNTDKKLIVDLKDENGNPISGVPMTVNFNGVKTYTTDKNGQIKVPTKNLAPKKYVAKITFPGNTNYEKTTKDVKVTVKKATPKLTAKKKTFKRAVKTKKYSITLNSHQNKAMKGIKVILKLNKKIYFAKTNKKGVAIFKITKLVKMGKYFTFVKFLGNKYYGAKTVKQKITVK